MLIDRLIEIGLEDQYAELLNYPEISKSTFKKLDIGDRYRDFQATETLKLDASEIYTRYGIKRPCCMEEISQMHVIPDPAPKRPPTSKLQRDDGSVQKYLRMVGRDYVIKQVYEEDVGGNLNENIEPVVQKVKIKNARKTSKSVKERIEELDD